VIAQAFDDGQIVLDHQHRAALRRLADELGDAADVLAAHAGGRLVEQQNLRIERQRRGDLQRALAAIGQIAGAHPGPFREAEFGEQLHRPSVQRFDRPLSARQKSKFVARFCCRAKRTFSSAVKSGKIEEIW
jgi:hypothetical protein